jgi:nitroreductase
MDFLALAEQRYSCRLHVLATEQYRDQLRTIYRHDWFVEAPYVVAMVALLDRAWCHRDGKNLGLVDAAIAFDHLLLAAAAEGLGSCWVAAFNRPNAEKFLKTNVQEDILAFSPIGYANDTASGKVRKPLAELVCFGVK